MTGRPQPARPDDFVAEVLAFALRWWRDDVRRLSLREVGKALPLDNSHLSKIEHAVRPIPPGLIPQLDRIYRTGGRLAALQVALAHIEKPGKGTVQTNPSARNEEDATERRAAIQLLAAIGAGAAIPPGTLEDLFSGVEPITGDTMSTADWEEIVSEHWHSWAVKAPGSLLAGVTTDYAEISRLLRRGSAPVSRAGLLRLSAQLGTLMAIELSDVGQQAASITTWRMARRAADAAGDRDLRVLVRGFEAQYAFWGGRPPPVSARLAAEAVAISGDRPTVGLARAHAALAYASAEDDAGRSHAALHDLAEVYQRLPSSTTSRDTSPMWRYSERSLSWNQAAALASTGDIQSAFQAIDRALSSLPADYYHGDIANLTMLRALTQVKDHDVTEGLAAALSVAHAQPPSATRRLITGQIIHALPGNARALPAAQELKALLS